MKYNPVPFADAHRGETAMQVGGAGLADIEAPVADGLMPLPDERETVALPGPRVGHLGNTGGDSWRLFPCTSGWALTFQSWPSDSELENLCAVLARLADKIHRCDIELPENLPGQTYVASLLSEVLANLGDVPIAIWHAGKLRHRYNGYQRYDPLRPRRGFLSTIY